MAAHGASAATAGPAPGAQGRCGPPQCRSTPGPPHSDLTPPPQPRAGGRVDRLRRVHVAGAELNPCCVLDQARSMQSGAGRRQICPMFAQPHKLGARSDGPNPSRQSCLLFPYRMHSWDPPPPPLGYIPTAACCLLPVDNAVIPAPRLNTSPLTAHLPPTTSKNFALFSHYI